MARRRPAAGEPVAIDQTPLHSVRDVRIVGVPTLGAIKFFGTGPAALRPFARRFHPAPCSLCNSVCCCEKVCINIVDLARLVIALGVRADQVVTLTTEHKSTITIPALIGGQRTHMLLRQEPVEGLARPACHMLARPGGQLRCGVHAVRPGVCRAYPFRFFTDRGDFFYVGLPHLCPINWALAPSARRAIEREIVAWRRENDAAERMVRRWNRT
ncbi:MAG: YkgJ family cysteine cluster protein, partial [Deltaproteobacteria bacterium]|nr:YkgJ family cysteine cluster protein [Deltaproteobacteria bacterium]